MNTKQLHCALMRNPSTEPIFDGIFSADNIVDIVSKPQLIICNTDPSTKPGKHWILFFFTNDTCEFFDSLGKPLHLYAKSFTKIASKYAKYIKFTLIRIQPKESSLCGHYCLYFSILRSQGKSMKNIIKQMKTTSPHNIVKFVKQNFALTYHHNCKFLQTCVQ